MSSDLGTNLTQLIYDSELLLKMNLQSPIFTLHLSGEFSVRQAQNNDLFMERKNAILEIALKSFILYPLTIRCQKVENGSSHTL